MTTMVAWLPFFFAAYFAFFRSPEKAVLNVYLPVLLLLPPFFVADTTGFPKLTFHETAIIPIFIATVFFYYSKWKFSFADLLMVLFIVCTFIAEAVNENVGYGINKLATNLCDIFAPYAVGKALIYPRGINIAFSKRAVFLMFINVIISVYEMRMTANPQMQLMSWFFPNQTYEFWFPLHRFGLVRISGPFIQTILFGIGLSVVILLNYWLIKNKFWSKNFKNLPHLLFDKGTLLAIALVLGLIFTFSRGPWIATFFGFLIIGAAFSKNIFRSFAIRIGLGVLAFVIFLQTFLAYQAVAVSESEQEATIVYRSLLWKQYRAYVEESPIWGYGLKNFPEIKGMRSIDNGYIVYLLQYGSIAFVIYLVLLFWVLGRLVRQSLRAFKKAPLYSTLALALFAILITMSISFFSVFIDFQPKVLSFLFLGWSEGLLLSKVNDAILLKEREKLHAIS